MNLPPNLNEVIEFVEQQHPKGIALAARALVELDGLLPRWRDPVKDPPTGDTHRDVLARISPTRVVIWTWRPGFGLGVDVRGWMEIPR